MEKQKQPNEKQLQLDKLLQEFKQVLLGQGFETYCLSASLRAGDGWDSVVHLAGESHGILTAVVGSMAQLRPQDFQFLLRIMMNDPLFAYHRETEPDKKKQMVN